MPEKLTLRIRKEALKFASSHMTVFPDGTKEALHGHQYVPTVTVEVQIGHLIPFSDVKAAMKKISEAWDEKVLLAEKNAHFQVIKKSKASIHFRLCKKEYLLPIDEVVFLPISNVICEELAQVYSHLLAKYLPALKKAPFLSWSVDIEESPGQGATYTISNRVKS